VREAIRKYCHWQTSNQNILMIFFDIGKFREGMQKIDFMGMVFPLRHKMKWRLDRDNSLSCFFTWPPNKRKFVFASCPLCPLSFCILLMFEPMDQF